MTRRSAVTLMEVLIAMFIMAIGMLALLALFPVGAVSMAQALKDDRCASTAAMAENVAVAADIRHDTNVNTAFQSSSVVYVDAYGAIQLLPAVGGLIPRVAPSSITNSPTLANQLTDRWFSLPDDIGFLEGGTPDTANLGGAVDRGRRYSYAYMLRQLPTSALTPSNLIQLYVVVYSGRPTSLLSAETSVTATVTSTNSVLLSTTISTAKRGGWILSLDTGTMNNFGTLGTFYRISNLVESGGAVTLETQQSFPTGSVGGNITIVMMDDVAEVFDKGTSWQP